MDPGDLWPTGRCSRLLASRAPPSHQLQRTPLTVPKPLSPAPSPPGSCPSPSRRRAAAAPRSLHTPSEPHIRISGVFRIRRHIPPSPPLIVPRCRSAARRIRPRACPRRRTPAARLTRRLECRAHLDRRSALFVGCTRRRKPEPSPLALSLHSAPVPSAPSVAPPHHGSTQRSTFLGPYEHALHDCSSVIPSAAVDRFLDIAPTSLSAV